MTTMRPSDAFAVLGLEPSFEIAARDLRAAWMRRAAAAHPDAAGAVAESARVNDAMRVLSDPIQRAQALLELRGVRLSEARALPRAFLLEMMELRERADDAAGDPAAGAALRAEAVERREAEIARIGALFAEIADGVGPIAAIEESILAVRAFDRMLEQLAREEQRSEGDVP